MTGRERILAALRREPVNRTPVGSILTVVTDEMMQATGHFWPAAHQNAEGMAALACAAHTMCGFDSVKLPFDMTVELEALGGTVDFGDAATLPQARGHLFEFGERISIPTDFERRGRIPLVHDAIRLAHEQCPTAAIVTSVVGPLALATKLFGTEDILIATITEPNILHNTLEDVTQVIIRYARSLIEAGSDVILIGDPVTSGDLISAETYREHILAHHRRLISAIDAPCVLHVCGCIDNTLPHFAQTGAAGLSFDVKTDASKAKEAFGDRIARIGWVDPLDVMLRGSAQDAYAASLDCLRAGTDILTPGCALSPQVPNENLLAMRRAAEDIGTTRASGGQLF